MDGQRERDRARRGAGGGGGGGGGGRADRDRSAVGGRYRLYVSNVPFDFHWTKLKDLFKEKVGSVTFVELASDESGKSKGHGLVEFSTNEAKEKALDVMHRYEINGRKIVVREETNQDKERRMRASGNSGPGAGRGQRDDKDRGFDDWSNNDLGMGDLDPERYSTYGLSTQFLDSINVQPPLVKTVFVANLAYTVDQAKLKEIFKMAGKVRHIDLCLDKEGKSRGFAMITYDHPVEAVQAISMFDKQMLYGRKLTVRMDRANADKPTVLKLPEGLTTIGLGLGPNGDPLRDVARNISGQSDQPANVSLSQSSANFGSGILGAVPGAAASVALNGLGTSLGASGLGAGNALAGNLGLQALGLTGLGALQSQLLQQGLNANDLAGNLANALTAQSAALNLAQTSSMPRSNNDHNRSASSSMGNGSYNNSTIAGSLMGNSTQSNVARYGQSGSQGGGGYEGMGGARSVGSGGLTAGQGYGRDSTMQHPKREKNNSDTVIITNLPPTVTWQLVREKFSECGDVKFAEMTASDTAVVRFHKEWDAQMAIKMFDRTRIDGRTIDVRFF